MQDQLTIIIPTYQRSGFLARKLFHFSLQNCNSRIAIVDSSFEGHLEENQHTLESHGNQLDIFYRHFDPTTPFTSKVVRAAHESTTPYTVISFDDDFLILETAYDGVRFLNTHSDYASANGLVLSLIRSKNGVRDPIRVPVVGKSRVYSDPDPLKRITNFVAGATTRNRNPLFSVWRTDVLRQMLTVLDGVAWTKYVELLFDHLSTCAGRAKELEGLYDLRHVDYRKAEYRKHNGLRDFTRGVDEDLLDPLFHPVLSRASQLGAKFLQNQTTLSVEKATSLFVTNFLVQRAAMPLLGAIPEKADWYMRPLLPRTRTSLARLWRRGRYACALAAHPRRLMCILRMRGLYDMKSIGRMLQDDPELMFNHTSLMQTTASRGEAYRLVRKAAESRPDTL